jgi:two-component system response regulator FixJ
MTVIHIIDDDEALRAALAALIATWPDMRARPWCSGSAFLIGAPMLEPGVLLLDQDMPGATGLEVLRSVANDPRFAVVLMTGAANIRLAVECFQAGAVHLIEKPCDMDALRDALTEAAACIEERHALLVARERIDLLSPRERNVLDGLITGASNKLIAHEHGISPRTVEIYRGQMMEKLGVRSLSAAILLAFTAGLIPEAESAPIALAA